MTVKHLYPNSTPALNLNFKSSRVADPRLSCVRNSIGTYVDPVSGLIKTAGANEARVDKNGLMVEEERTNLISNQDLTNNYWQKFDLTAAASTITSPDGATNAYLMTETAQSPGVTAFHYIRRNNIATGVNTWGYSVFAKSNGRNIRLSIAGLGTQSVYFDLINGVVDAVSPGTTGKIEPLPNGWYRCTLTITATASAARNCNMYLLNGTELDYQGDGTSGVYVAFVQLEIGASPTSYIPTNGSTAQRLADVITINNSSIFNPNENTIINEDFGVAGGSDTLTVVGDGSKAERTFVYNSNLSQEQFNALTEVDDWWEWRVLGSSYAFPNLSGDGQVTVDWGDGTVETLTTSSHTFTNGSGYHTIRIKQENGTYLYLSPSPTERPKLISIGPVPTSINVWGQYLGFSCPNLETFDAHGANFLNAIYINSTSPKLKSTPYADYSSVTNFSYSWSGASGLTKMPHIDTSNGTNFTGCWWGDSGLTEFPALDFSSSASTGLRYAWNVCSGLTSFPSINLGNATNLENTWNGCSSLGSFPLLDTSNVTHMSATWSGCSSLTSFPLIDTSSVTNWRNTWNGCSGLTSFPLIDTSSGTDFYRTWKGCTSMVTFPAGCFDSWSPTTVQNYCFTETWDGCSSLSATSVENILDSIDTSGVSAPSTGPDITIDYNASSGTPNISTAVTNLKNRNWTITLNGVAQ